mgnify:CR=1 FL=1
MPSPNRFLLSWAVVLSAIAASPLVLPSAAADASSISSRQRYEKISDTHWRYHDLGVANGFSADLRLDRDGIIKSYEGLFETID